MQAIIVHGGAKTIPPEEQEAHRQGCLAAVRAGWEVLQAGGAAVDAVEAAIRVLEDDPTFNAAYGAALNAAGEVQMDAGLMDGKKLQAGAVGALQGVRNPISVARRLLDEKTVLMVGPDVRRFAEQRGLPVCDPADLITEKRRKEWEEEQTKTEPSRPQHDTVGTVALDSKGTVAAGASTGGTGNHPPGRVGDSPLVGCGFYAVNGQGGTALTGDGEEITRMGLARTILEKLCQKKSPEAAAKEAIDALGQHVQGEAGCIVLDEKGRIGWFHNSSHMAVGYLTTEMEAPFASVKKEEPPKLRIAA